MNYNQCLECLELNRENAELSDGQLAMLRSKLQIQTVEDKKVIRLKKDAALQMSYLEKGFKYAGIKCMVYDTKALGDYRNRWRIGGKMISQKMLCEAVEQIQAHGEQMPGMLQTEGLITEFLFAQSDAKVLLLEGRDECDKPVSYKVKKKNLKRQVADIENYKDVHLGTLGRDAIVGAYRVLEMLQELKMQGFDIEQGHLWKAFEETYVTPDFGLINSKPLMFTDEVLSGAQAHELAENITEYLPERPLVLILGATKETQIGNVLGALAPKAAYILTVSSPGRDRIPAYELAQKVLEVTPNVTAVDSLEEAYEIIQMVLPKDGAVVAAGHTELLRSWNRLIEDKNT